MPVLGRHLYKHKVVKPKNVHSLETCAYESWTEANWSLSYGFSRLMSCVANEQASAQQLSDVAAPIAAETNNLT